MSKYRAVRISKGSNGWGGPLVIQPTDKKKYVVSVTGGGIHPIAEQIAEMTGAEPIDGFTNKVESDEMACVVIDCGGTARCGVYPKMNVLTVNLTPTPPSGPLMKYIKEDNFVSGVRKHTIEALGKEEAATEELVSDKEVEEKRLSPLEVKERAKEKVANQQGPNRKTSILEKIGRSVGGVVNVFYQAGRETIEQIIRNILPF